MRESKSPFALYQRADFASLAVLTFTHMCVMIYPPKKRVLLIQKFPEGAHGLRPRSTPRYRGLASTSRDEWNDDIFYDM